MTSRLLEEMQWRAGLLMTGRYEDLARFYTCPLPVYISARRMVMPSRAHLSKSFEAMHQTLSRHGIAAVRAEITAQELPRNGRRRLWVTWHQVGQTRSTPKQSHCIYYMKSGPKGLLVEMFHYTKPMVPEMGRIVEDILQSA